jgi:23S rRNA pseudouridine2457 synthase
VPRPAATPPRKGAPAAAEPVTLLLHKPYGVLCQFTDPEGRPTLRDFVPFEDVYAAGRLDHDSEGLVVVTSVAWLKSRLTDPAHKVPRTYWAQVEGEPDEAALESLREGVVLADGPTLPARVRRLDPEQEPALMRLPPRHPPVQPRPGRPTAWIEIVLTEGRNRQVRRMTAAVGLPTLRLVRVAVGPWRLEGLGPGKWRKVGTIPAALFARPPRATPAKPRREDA